MRAEIGLCAEVSAKTDLGHDVPKRLTAPRRGEKGTPMTRSKDIAKHLNWKEVLAEQEDFLRGLIQQVVQEVLEAEMEEALGAGKGQRTANRLGYRSGYYSRTLTTRVGKLELRVPQDRQGRFRTEVFERYQRSEKALVAALAEMYVQGVSTRKVKAITEELCGHEFSASAISRINESLDEELAKFAGRRLEEEYPSVVVDARYEKIREDGVIRSQAVMVAIGINWDGRRCVLAVELASRESKAVGRPFWRDCVSAGSAAYSWWSAMITPDCARPYGRCCRKRCGKGAMCTSCAMRWIICRAKRMTTA
jgi:transposase-like protein